MIGATVGMALVLSTWLIIALAFTGVGLGLRWRFDNSQPDADDLFLCFWLGFAATLVFLQVWHSFWLIDRRVAAIVLVAGCVGHLVTRFAVFRTIISLVRYIRPWFAVLLFTATVWVSNKATAAPDFFDSGNYQIPMVRWVTTYPIVKGIGNVDPRLGMNNVSLLYQGMLEVGFWQRRSFHIGSGILALTVLLFCLYKLYECAIARRFSVHSLFAALILTAVVDTIDDVSTTATDLPTMLVMLVIAYFLVAASEAFFSRPAKIDPRAAAFRLEACLLLCAIAPAIKLSAAVYGLASALVLLALWLASREVVLRYRLRVAVTGSLIIVCAIGLWAGRTVVFTGYPFFPSLAIAFHVPWRIPDFYAEGYRWWVLTFARAPDYGHISGEGVEWIPAWITVQLRAAKIAGILPLILAIIALVHLGSRQEGRHMLRRLLPAWLPLLAALAVWLVSAPAFRFGEALTWILAAQCLALSVITLVSANPKRLYLTILAMCVLPCSAILMHAVLYKQTNHVGVLPALAGALWVPAGRDHGMQPVHETLVTPIRTEGGVAAYQPRVRSCDVDQWRDCVMWYGPIPGGARLLSALAYLSRPNPADGFVIPETRKDWIVRNAAEVQANRAAMNIRQLAVRFQVAPETIRLALEANESH